MKHLFTTSLAAALLATVGSALAADSAEAILKKHVDAMGGEAAYLKVKSRSMVATLEVPAQGLVAEIKITAKAPDKIRSEVEIPNMGKIVEGYDGKVAWSQNPFVGLTEKEGAQLEQTKRQADFYRDALIAKRYQTWTVKPNQSVDGKDAIVLVGSNPGKESETLFLDAKTYLAIKVESDVDTGQGKLMTTTSTSDYRDVNGLKLPFMIKVDSDMGNVSIKMKEIKLGVEAPDSLFTKPTN